MVVEETNSIQDKLDSEKCNGMEESWNIQPLIIKISEPSCRTPRFGDTVEHSGVHPQTIDPSVTDDPKMKQGNFP